MSSLRLSPFAALAAAAVFLAGASAAAAGTAIDVPAQDFAHGQAGAKPVVTMKQRPVASFPDRGPLAGRSFGLNMPLGAGRRLPLTVHILSSEEECHDDADINGAAQNQDQDFIRGGDH